MEFLINSAKYLREKKDEWFQMEFDFCFGVDHAEL